MTELVAIKPFDQAGGEIDAWRGRCLNWFARGEKAVIVAMKAARSHDPRIDIKHLAGQRLADLRAFVETASLTSKQRGAIEAALAAWSGVEERRRYLAHGVATLLFDTFGNWHVRLNSTACRENILEVCHWTPSQSEAEEYEAELASAFMLLSTRLGQLPHQLAA